MEKKKVYGYCYDKHGELKEVSAPVTADGKASDKPRKTVTGSIPASVGYPNFKGNKINKY